MGCIAGSLLFYTRNLEVNITFFYSLFVPVILLKSDARELNGLFLNNNKEQAEDFHLHGHKPHEEHHAPNPTLVSFQKGFDLLLNVTNLQLNCTKSPILHVNGMSWTLEFCNRAWGTNQNDSLIDITILPSVNENASLRWSCEANAIIKLFSLDTMNKSVTFNMTTQKFTNNGPSGYGFSTGINWKNFTHYYVNSGGDVKIHLNIASTKLRCIPDIEQNSAKFRFILDELSELRSDSSMKVRARGIKWQVLAKRNHGSLGVYLHADQDDMDINSAWQVTASFEILSLNGAASSNRKNFTTTFHRRMTNWGFAQFMSWNDLINPKNKYVDLDTAIFQVELEVDEPTSIWGID